MFSNFYINKIIRESTTIKSFYLKPKEECELEDYQPGQFVTVRVKTRSGEVVTRNYTLSDAPNGDNLRLTIKRETKGQMSRYFHDVLQVGDEIEVSAPMGDFHLNTKSTSPIVLISGGVGITPMISMLEYVSANQRDREIHFLHSSLDKNVQPFIKRLNDLKTANPNLKLSIYHSTPLKTEKSGLDYDFEGFIDKDGLSRTVSQDSNYFLCGPSGFMNAMYDHLVDLNVPEEDILYEFFGQGKKLGTERSNDNSESQITVLFSGSGIETLWNSDMSSILDLAESEGLAPPSSCRMGTCSTCESQLLGGTILYDPEPFMMPSADDKIFICCARPTSDINLNI
ncbi:2Fe-2S iron-sulfur cluster-binding protein [Flaviramulus aquimarinus]|uniref:2Fe-2S iron-sulfur cluster-binding protein n=1 Tax=Flaviramulus aquimarinus TaxID=1170456 RepID=A0ABP9ETD7_9FLAO